MAGADRLLRWGWCSVFFIAACSPERAVQHADDTLVSNRPDIIATNAFYYYHDVDAAWAFYRDTLGFETVVDYGFAKILRLADSSYLTVVQADEGMHSADEPKIVTLHLVTDQLRRWREYLVQQGIQVESDSANSFDIRDSEGYRLRFVRYNPHPNHDTFVDSFARARPVLSSVNELGEMGIRATAFSVFYSGVEDVRPFFEGLFGTESAGLLDGVLLYQLSGSGFVALEEYGAQALASPGENGMTLSFITTDVDAWFERASDWPGFRLRTEQVLNEGGLVRVFVGHDPTGVFLEWDTFLDVPENRALLEYLK
jgi:uncharacterized glyoxalase superfamily protein PhnB